MDAIDQRIVAELRANGRLSNVELAGRVGLTPAPCRRRGLGAVPGIAKVDPHLTMKVVKSPDRRPAR